jgi:exopolyphosphatase/guanosine-5'-triphosphate,3'-diphosphate pyrophosphatase
MGNTERIWLQAAALLHDIGKKLNSRGHHKHSQDLIITSKQLPFRKKGRILIGLIARYHRGALPNRNHKYFGKLDSESRFYIRKLAALLKLADGLDSNHLGSVTDISCKITDDNIIVYPKTCGPFYPQKALEKADLLEAVFNREVVTIEQLAPILPYSNIELTDNFGHTDMLN